MIHRSHIARQALGNAAFSAGNYADAVKHFTDAIGVDAANHVFYSNRSAAYAALNDFDAALNDAEKTVAIKPDWVKGYSRKGAALYGLKRYDDACDAYQKGLDLEPDNDACKSGLADAETAAVRAMGAAGDGGDPRTHAISMIRMRPSAPTWNAITDGHWRLTINADDGQPSELFDLASDPDEATNLVDHPSTAEPMKALSATLTATVGSHDSEG